MIELEIEVPGSPEEVWRAIATGPGITSWFVPTVVEEAEGGAMTQSFGSGPEAEVAGRVRSWEPPGRVVFDGGEVVPGLAFEWLVEARDGGNCVVRLVNSGFGSGEEWDAEFDSMRDGWVIFLRNLRLHLTHFSGRTASVVMPMLPTSTSPEETWRLLREAWGLPSEPAPGDVLEAGPGLPDLRGTIVDLDPGRSLTMVLDEPAPGTAFVAAEGTKDGPGALLSVWLYLYGDDAADLADQLGPQWQHWLESLTAR
jgi:uncharacterized protein YndB with AHSA1/START domain